MRLLGTAALGCTFGFCISRTGFTSWDLMHGMFTLEDPRLALAFAMAVVLLAGSWAIIGRVSASSRLRTPRPFHPGILGGGALFGVGWALSGGCPTVALAQIGEGQLAAVYTLGGIFVGNYLYLVVHERFFHWPTTSCSDE